MFLPSFLITQLEKLSHGEKELDGVLRSTPKYILCVLIYYRILEVLSAQGAVLRRSDGFSHPFTSLRMGYIHMYPILQMRKSRLLESKDPIQDYIDAGKDSWCLR